MKNKKNEAPQLWEEWDGEYIGNIWGWKFSIIALVLISLLIAFMAYRHATLDQPVGGDVPAPTPEKQEEVLNLD